VPIDQNNHQDLSKQVSSSKMRSTTWESLLKFLNLKIQLSQWKTLI